MRTGAIVIGLLALVGCGGHHAPDFGDPADLDWSPDGTSIVLERVIDSDSLAKKSRKVLRWVTGEGETSLLTRPYGVAWAGDELIVTDPGGGRVVRVDRKGRASASPAGTFETPVGVASCKPGIVVTDSGRGEVAVLDGSLVPARILADGLDRPTGIACDDSRIYVVETGHHRILVFPNEAYERADDSTTTAAVATWGKRGEGEAEFNFPAALAVGRADLFVGDTLNFRIQQLETTAGAPLQTFGRLGDAPGEMPRIKGLALDPSGHLWISDAHLDQIAIYTTDGAFLMHLGGTGPEPGRFSFPAGIAAHPDGRMAVVDSLNRRLQIFRVLTSETAGGG